MARRLLENGDDRLLNNDDYRLLEPVLVAGTGATETDTANGGTPWAVVTIAANRSHETDRTFLGDPFVQWIVFGNRADETDLAVPGNNNLTIPDTAPQLALFDRTSVATVNANRQAILDSTTFATLENR
jgi:hypothetical protein